MSDAKNTIPPYLKNNSWEEELNYKLWSTRGARFQAARRCEDMAHLSQTAVTFLTTYLIIIGLIPFVPYSAFKTVPPELLSFGTTAVSIVLLAYSLLEHAKNYGLRAHEYHECALHVSRLYDALRQAKEIEDAEQKRAQIARITAAYERMLPMYRNHEAIDSDMFQTQKPDYYKLDEAKCAARRRSYYWRVKLRYHMIIVAPVFLFFVFLFFGLGGA